MKRIPLTQGKFAIVDDDMYEYLSQWKWHAKWNNSTKSFYACRTDRSVGKKNVYMARVIMNTPDGLIADHINHDTLNNTRQNLRNVTQSVSKINTRASANNKIGERGIRFRDGKYIARLEIKKKAVFQKRFNTLDEAKTYYAEQIAAFLKGL